MISLICTTEPTRIDWLSQFVHHYRALGVERFFLSLQLEPDLDPMLRLRYRAQFEDTLASLDIDNALYLEKSFDAFAIRDHHDSIQDAYTSPDDWIVWCDSDEFQRYPITLDKMIERWRKFDITHVYGRLLDRVARDGQLSRFDPMISVWDQFPIVCSFSADVATVMASKVTVSRGDVLLSCGNHALALEAPAMLTPASERRLAKASIREMRHPENRVQVHHFKWDASVLERLRFRLSPQWQTKCPWWTESSTMLEYFERNGGRFNLDDLSIIELNNDQLMVVRTIQREEEMSAARA